MTRRTALLTTLMLVLAGMVVFSALPAGASRSAALDPALLQLPPSALPPGAVIDHSAISDNPDADGNTTPPDGFKSQLKNLHQNLYEALGRQSGYREDFHWQLQGSPVGTEYLASIFLSADKAKAAMQDAIADGTLITLIGTPLAHQCSVGDMCRAYSGANPFSPPTAPTKVVLAVFTEGPILVETASQVLVSQFDALEPALETSLFGFLAAADAQAKLAINGSKPATTSATTDTPTAVATETSVPPTSTPTPKPVKKCKKGYGLAHGKCTKCKKGYKVIHGKCKKVH